jgi:hypothetical protein
MSSRIIRFLLGVVIGVAIAPAALVANASPGGVPRIETSALAQDAAGEHPDLAAARRATARFHKLEHAIAAGYPADATGCLDFPNGYMDFGPGAMSTHWINWEYYGDGGALDPTQPEALLYEPEANGKYRLVAVEYIVPESDLPSSAPPPVLFGRELMFHPDFDAWAVHVWLWKDNPYGLYADVNPNVTCEHADQSADESAHAHH